MMGDCRGVWIAVLARPFDFPSEHAHVRSKLPMSIFTAYLNWSLASISISIAAFGALLFYLFTCAQIDQLCDLRSLVVGSNFQYLV